MDPFDSPRQLQAWLRTQEIDLSAWGRNGAKTVEHLWAEIRKGETQIELDPPRRLVNVVRVLVRRGDQVLIEAQQEFRSGQRRLRDSPPSEKIKPGESYEEAALRCLQEEVGVDRADVELYHDTYRRAHKEGPSPSYPGLRTRYTFHMVEARVEGLPNNDFSTRERAADPGDPVETHHWTWK